MTNADRLQVERGKLAHGHWLDRVERTSSFSWQSLISAAIAPHIDGAKAAALREWAASADGWRAWFAWQATPNWRGGERGDTAL
jgi:hypothetical protein